MFIYKMENVHNGKVYIGQTIHTVEKRVEQHLKEMKYGKHHNPVLQNTYNKYGDDCFVFEVLASARHKIELDELECFYINLFMSDNKKYGYNLKGGGSNGSPNIETRRKISESHKNMVRSEDHKRKIVESCKRRTGDRHSEEAKRLVSEKAKKRWEKKRLSGDMSGASKNMTWWNNGIKNTRSLVCPGDGWVSGFLPRKKAGCVWWTDGTKDVFAVVCPDGWTAGRAFRKRTPRRSKA